MQPDLTAGIVRILHADGSTAGTGFVVSADGLIATCSHVVQSEQSQLDGEPRPERVAVVFDAAGEPRQAIVEADWWRSYDAGDIAILRVEGDLPEGIHPLPLGSSKKASGHPFISRGYRLTEHFPGGLDAEGRIQSATPYRGQPALPLLTNQIDQGMSGAPVFDTHTRRVVGMVNFFWETKRHVDAWLAGAVPAETLKAVCDALTLRLPQLVEDYLTALGQFCRDLPYVSLRSKRTITQVYVRQQMREKPRDERQVEDEEQARRHKAEMQRTRPMPIEEALAQHPLLAIVGGPGAGKSTLLRHLVEEQLVPVETVDSGKRFVLLRDSKVYLPILVSLRGLAEQQGDLRTCLHKQIEVELDKRLPAPLTEGFLDDWAPQTGAAWLIALDGLDEIVNADRRMMLLRELSQIPWPSDSRIVFTTRPDETVAGTKDFKPFDLLPFETEQVEEFAQNWFGPDEAKVTAFLRNVLASQLGDLIGTPLLLTVAATVFEEAIKRTSVPEGGVLAGLRRSTLYERFINTLLDEDAAPSRQMREQFIKEFRTDLGEKLFDYRREILEHIALETLEGWSAITVLAGLLQGEPLKWHISDVEKKAGDVLDILARQRTGLLVRRGSDYEFIHPTFSEYLAAAAIVRKYNSDLNAIWKDVIPLWDTPGYHEIMLFTLGVLSDNGENLTKVVKWISERSEEGLYFAGDALAERVNVEGRLKDAIIDRLVAAARAMSWFDTLSTPNALTILGKLGDYPGTVEGLLAVGRDSQIHEEVRLEAARTLYRCGRGNEAAQAWLALAWDKRVGAGVRTEAAKALGELGRIDEAAPILLALARDEHVDAGERTKAAEMLGKLDRADEAAPILLALARDEHIDAGERTKAAQALGELGRVDEAAPILLALARDERIDAGERTKAAEALGKLDRILLALADDGRVAAAQALGELGRADEAAPILLALARDERIDAWVRTHAAAALGRLGQADEAVQAWLALACDEHMNADVHRAAVEALSELGRADGLLALAHDERVDVGLRRTAAYALGKLDRANDLLALTCNERVDAGVRRTAVYVLGNLSQADEAVPVLLALARDEHVDVSVRRAAADVLGGLGQADKAVPILLALARDERVNVRERWKAVNVLGELGQADDLLVLVRDARVDARVRQAAEAAIREIRERTGK